MQVTVSIVERLRRVEGDPDQSVCNGRQDTGAIAFIAQINQREFQEDSENER